jgi:hypothetical protein
MTILHPLRLPKLLLLPKRFRIQLELLRHRCSAFVTRLRDLSCARLPGTWAKLQRQLGHYRYRTCGQPWYIQRFICEYAPYKVVDVSVVRYLGSRGLLQVGRRPPKSRHSSWILQHSAWHGKAWRRILPSHAEQLMRPDGGINDV